MASSNPPEPSPTLPRAIEAEVTALEARARASQREAAFRRAVEVFRARPSDAHVLEVLARYDEWARAHVASAHAATTHRLASVLADLAPVPRSEFATAQLQALAHDRFDRPELDPETKAGGELRWTREDGEVA